MLGGMINDSLISISIKNGDKFVLTSLAPLIIQLLYLQKFFVTSCLCMQKVGKYFPHDTRKAFATSAKGSGLY